MVRSDWDWRYQEDAPGKFNPKYKGEILFGKQRGKEIVPYLTRREIETQKAFPMKPILFFAVKQQLKDKNYPALKNIPDVSSYDTIFVGSPVWWYTAATPVLSLLNQMDFQGKKVVPFSTQGSNPGTFLEDFTAKAKNAVIQKYASFNNLGKKYDQAVNAKIAEWLNNL